eukprot:TRINITY_DN12123_c1_g5_i1.p1 TRINITY_DN12123_c1_g5~~TRINITY_DN12123_c1_g5_i1.p1  ORF type:complete len:426 (+),score=112.41 TRINITY_DN12123_c1_g5_i1:50-1327(+)
MPLQQYINLFQSRLDNVRIDVPDRANIIFSDYALRLGVPDDFSSFDREFRQTCELVQDEDANLSPYEKACLLLLYGARRWNQYATLNADNTEQDVLPVIMELDKALQPWIPLLTDEQQHGVKVHLEQMYMMEHSKRMTWTPTETTQSYKRMQTCIKTIGKANNAFGVNGFYSISYSQAGMLCSSLGQYDNALKCFKLCVKRLHDVSTIPAANDVVIQLENFSRRPRGGRAVAEMVAEKYIAMADRLLQAADGTARLAASKADNLVYVLCRLDEETFFRLGKTKKLEHFSAQMDRLPLAASAEARIAFWNAQFERCTATSLMRKKNLWFKLVDASLCWALHEVIAQRQSVLYPHTDWLSLLFSGSDMVTAAALPGFSQQLQERYGIALSDLQAALRTADKNQVRDKPDVQALAAIIDQLAGAQATT